jgi:L-aminopeptidase/D-esterase-like protein
MNDTITAVPGMEVGHASSASDLTGCTVLLGPFRGAIDIRGLATGTREVDALSPSHLVHQIDAILLTGGSAPGLAAADGVVEWLRERGRGFAVGPTQIPIVPAAVIFDIKTSQQRSPDAAMGRAACDAASNRAVREGRVGAGTGATVGKMLGPANVTLGGLGSYAAKHGDYTIGAIAVVNAFGDVIDERGEIIAGARNSSGEFANSMALLQAGLQSVNAPITNTTICAVATDAPLTRVALQTVARMGSSAVVRRIAPANTVFDGDVVFAVSTSESARELPAPELLSIGVTAQLALERAIIRAVSASV